ncbi:ABC transporter ATP-binding protein [Erysipelothrix inopinata]|uniref:ABC transporter ATP-binding protein n=1 Tax=Erysipelothrix inopinata TaxID=225084 RepID=A0A7G9RZ56_9FIRM|nr:ABC transporter ATP-binding protein [Erysipelothrix inopinata]QNN60881.1 ABC transporter ATP-binding protein [Erysipelothrix inopinata]
MNPIKVNALTKDFGSNRGIFNLNFEIKAGEVVGFIGANGAGKTTTIRHLMGFMKPDYGVAEVLGFHCFEQAPQIQEHIGYLPGEISLFDDLSAQEFIYYIAELKGIKNTQEADNLMKYFELSSTTKIKKMSKGMKQKTALVVAFMQHAPILILDEPTSGLDPLMQQKFIELIKKEKASGTTILMSSHIFDEIEHTCDRVLLIKDGEIKVDESMTDIKKKRNKHYEIEFTSESDAEEFKSFYPNSVTHKANLTLIDKSDITELLNILHQFPIVDFNSRDQSLEEVFLSYYGGNES